MQGGFKLVEESGKPVESGFNLVDERGKPLEEEKQPPSTLRRAASWAYQNLVPTPRTAAQMLGGAIGGAVSVPSYLTGPGGVAVTALGGGAGYAGAGALYDVLTGQPYQGSPTQDVLTGAIQEVGGPIAAKGISRAAESRIPTAVERAISPATRREKLALRQVSEELSKDFPVAATEFSLYQKAKLRLNDYGRELTQAWARLPVTSRVPTARARITLQQERRSLFNAQGQIIPGTEQKVALLTELIDYLQQNPTLSKDDILNHRQLWDKVVDWWRVPRGGKSTEPVKEEVYEIAANELRDTINQTFPQIARLNKKVSIYMDAVKMLESADIAKVGKPSESYIRKFFPETVGATTGGALGWLFGSGREAGEVGAVIGAGAVGLRQLMNTVAYQTASIPVKKQVVRLMNQGLTQEALGVLMGQAARPLLPGTTVNIQTGEER